MQEQKDPDHPDAPWHEVTTRCQRGGVRLQPVKVPPPFFRLVVIGEHPNSPSFKANNRAYNPSAFQMAFSCQSLPHFTPETGRMSNLPEKPLQAEKIRLAGAKIVRKLPNEGESFKIRGGE